jgi:hypothetical protein
MILWHDFYFFNLNKILPFRKFLILEEKPMIWKLLYNGLNDKSCIMILWHKGTNSTVLEPRDQ